MSIIISPFVSVIMPVHNESAHITQTLAAVLGQDYPADKLEILIADGMSSDDTREKIAALRGPFPVIVLENPGRIVPTGLNLAIRRAKGEIIVRVDGHTVIAPDYVRQCVEALRRSGAQNVGGRMNAQGRGPFGQVVALATSTPFGVGGARFHYSEAEEWVDTVYMGAWPRTVFEQIGLFDEELVRDQDDEFNYRLRAHGGRILLSPFIRSEYTVRSTPRALWRQYYQYGLWKIRVLQKHPRQMRPRQFIPPAFALSLLFSLALASSFIFHISYFVLFPLAIILASYLIANLAASIVSFSKFPKSQFPNHLITYALLPMIFAILHLSYGLGFLAGLIKFANRWGDKQGRTPTL